MLLFKVENSWSSFRNKRAEAMATRQAIDAVMQNISLKERAKTHRELEIALKK
ncbi:MAG: hypothetical protein QMD14_05800 [Candidatus Aenigmarchaeota archaeon]|nr:hypothetical protein [Candidatus Aenigmarchaeota archaeon]